MKIEFKKDVYYFRELTFFNNDLMTQTRQNETKLFNLKTLQT